MTKKVPNLGGRSRRPDPTAKIKKLAQPIVNQEKDIAKALATLPEPPEGSDEQEVLLAKVERLMLFGVTRSALLSARAGISVPTARAYKERIYTRWAMQGKLSDLNRARGEARARIQRVMDMMLEQYEDPKSGRQVKVQAARYVLDCNDRLMVLDNLTPKTLPMLGTDDTSSAVTVDERIRQHSDMLRLANGLIKYVAKRKDIPDITDAEYVEVPRPTED